MSMSKKDFIALADSVKTSPEPFSDTQLKTLVSFCKGQNYSFNESRWLGYVKGENGSSGGKIKKTKEELLEEDYQKKLIPA